MKQIIAILVLLSFAVSVDAHKKKKCDKVAGVKVCTKLTHVHNPSSAPSFTDPAATQGKNTIKGYVGLGKDYWNDPGQTTIDVLTGQDSRGGHVHGKQIGILNGKSD